jgi:hypothetical protein
MNKKKEVQKVVELSDYELCIGVYNKLRTGLTKREVVIELLNGTFCDGYPKIEKGSEALEILKKFDEWYHMTRIPLEREAIQEDLTEKYNEIYKKGLETFQLSASKGALDSIAKINKLFDDKVKFDGSMELTVVME